MAIKDNTDIEVSCDGCGATANVDVTNAVLHKLAQRDWETRCGNEKCPDCAKKDED